MKKTILLLIVLLATVAANAKDIKTVVVTTTPQMHCASCENRIKSNIRFEKGVKKIKTNIPDQTVTITYDADQTSVEKIIEGFKKIEYEASVVQPCKKERKDNKKGGCCAK